MVSIDGAWGDAWCGVEWVAGAVACRVLVCEAVFVESHEAGEWFECFGSSEAEWVLAAFAVEGFCAPAVVAECFVEFRFCEAGVVPRVVVRAESVLVEAAGESNVAAAVVVVLEAAGGVGERVCFAELCAVRAQVEVCADDAAAFVGDA